MNGGRNKKKCLKFKMPKLPKIKEGAFAWGGENCLFS
jgi:hypothetical protein